MPSISVSHLSKYYSVHKKEPGLLGTFHSFFSREFKTIKAVDEISFSIEEGEIVGFIGPNGAGKTTTLKCLSGLLYPTSGDITVLGYTPFQRKTAFLKQIALVMGQKNQLWWDLPAADSFLLNKEIYEITDRQYQETLHDLIELLEVEEQLKIPVKNLSLGQRMKMELIAALIHRPKVLFLDEPTIGLDVLMQKKIREFLKEYNHRYHATVLLTSHYMKDVETLSKRVIIINYGKILFDGLLGDLIKKYAPYKQITLILKDKIDEKKLKKFGEIKLCTFPKLVLHVKEQDTTQAASYIFKHIATEDVVIEEPSIEDVIRDIFAQEQKEDHT